jgi:hypothetical protein
MLHEATCIYAYTHTYTHMYVYDCCVISDKRFAALQSILLCDYLFLALYFFVFFGNFCQKVCGSAIEGWAGVVAEVRAQAR